MPRLLILLAFLSTSLSANTYQVGKLSLGLLSPQGLIGANYEKSLPIKEEYSYSPSLGLALDPVGFLKTAGVRGFKSFSVDDSKWYNRCFFHFKDCERFWSFSVYAHHTDGGTTTIEKSNSDLKYSTGSGWMSSLAAGTRVIVNKRWLFDVEISKRFLVSGMEVNQKEGSTNDSERESLEDRRTSYGFSFGVGLLF
jgi:hypothetical protein